MVIIIIIITGSTNSVNQINSHFHETFSRTESSSTVNECRVNFGFLPAKSQIYIRRPTASIFTEVYCARK